MKHQYVIRSTQEDDEDLLDQLYAQNILKATQIAQACLEAGATKVIIWEVERKRREDRRAFGLKPENTRTPQPCL